MKAIQDDTKKDQEHTGTIVWNSVKDCLPIPVYDQDGVNSVLIFHANYPENLVPYEVWNAEYARLHPLEYDAWMDFPQYQTKRDALTESLEDSPWETGVRRNAVATQREKA